MQKSSQAANTLAMNDAESRREPAEAAEPPFVTRVRLRAQRRVLWMRALWTAEQSGPAQGLAITHGEVDRITADPAEIASQEAARPVELLAPAGGLDAAFAAFHYGADAIYLLGAG